MKFVLLVAACLFTSCASISLSVGSDTYINNGNVYNTTATRTDTVTVVHYVNTYSNYDYEYSSPTSSDYSFVSSDLAHAEFLFNAGFGMYQSKDNDYYGTNVNLSIGGDLYLRLGPNRVTLGLMPAIGYYYSERSDVRVHSGRFELGFKLSIGGTKVHGYIMPMIIANLGNSIQGNKYKIPYDDVAHTNGVEFGVRYMGWSSIVCSFYVRIEDPMLSLRQHGYDDDAIIFSGIRIGY